MLKNNIDAFIGEDAKLAKNVCERDNIVDGLREQIIRELFTFMISDTSTIERSMHLIRISHNLERPKIHLRLKARFRLKTHIGDSLLFSLDLMHFSFYYLIASGKTHIAESIVNPGGRVFQIFIQPKCDVAIERIQQALPLLIFSLLSIPLLSMYFFTVFRLIPSFFAICCWLSSFLCKSIKSKMVSFFSNRAPLLYWNKKSYYKSFSHYFHHQSGSLFHNH